MAKRDYYEVLGVQKTASADDISRAFKTQKMRWHPDNHPDDPAGAEVKFKEISEAYEVLSDASKKRAYDTGGHAASDAAKSSNTTGSSPAKGTVMTDINDLATVFRVNTSIKIEDIEGLEKTGSGPLMSEEAKKAAREAARQARRNKR